MARVSIRTDGEGHLRLLGAVIRAKRKERDMSQEALADAAGIDRSHMGKIERGERNLSLLSLLKISSALGSRASILLSDCRL